MVETVLVPVDGSSHSRRALQFATRTFADAEVVVLHVVDPFEVIDGPGEEAWNRDVADQHERDAETLLEEYVELAGDDVPVRTELRHGTPSRAIVGAADDLDVDHVVIGSRGRTGVGRVLLGSVAETVARRAPTSVTIVRGDD